GEVTGWFYDQPGAEAEGFVREPDGTIKGIGGITSPKAINAKGEVTGLYGDGATEGFVYMPDGTLTYFGVANSAQAASPTAINATGRITGSYYDPSTNLEAGFIYRPNHSLVTFALPGATQTLPQSIDPC